MTRTMLAPAETYRRRLRESALDNYGYVTTRTAKQLGVPSGEMAKLSARGGLTNVAYGLYRFDDIPPTRLDQYLEAVLRVGPGAHLTGDAVLALHDLGLVNPRRLRVGTPRRTRPRLPDFIEVVHEDLPTSDITTYEGIPSATVGRALRDSRGIVMRDRLVDAAETAAREGLLGRREAAEVLDVVRSDG